MIYLDTSAYLAILFQEKDSASIEKRIKGKILCTSTLMFFEAERNVVNQARLQRIPIDIFDQAMERILGDFEGFHIKDVTVDLLFTKAFPAVATPKTADLIHLRTALWFASRGELELFVTVDIHQKKAAREFGLAVI